METWTVQYNKDDEGILKWRTHMRTQFKQVLDDGEEIGDQQCVKVEILTGVLKTVM